MDTDSDVPDSGAVFTFGKSRFADNVPGKFWIRDDPILHVACGDEHTAFLTASGRVFTFGSNEWGQLGHGHTNALTKPSCVKGLKHERATVLACGRSHTLVATDTGHVYGFGTNAEGQLGAPHEYTIHTAPVRVQGLEDVAIKMLSGGADHSMALTGKGSVYVWGSGSEGQLGLEKTQCFVPAEVKFDVDVMCISAGYYHSAFITVDGNVYTCGENDSGKLGLPEARIKRSFNPQRVSGINGCAVYASCGGNHTVVLTAGGKAYSFGSGFNGQLGLGDRILESSSAHQITYLGKMKIARVSCGENHTGLLSDVGCLYTCGDSRHGKLGLLDENPEGCCNQFFPILVKRFWDFQIQQVACGGCHMVVLATMRKRLFDQIDGSCPNRERVKKAKLPPIYSQFATMGPQPKSNGTSMTTLRGNTHLRLPNITKSPVWYVPLEKVGDESANQDNDDDEVLSRLERHSLLDDFEEDQSIRHVDSDIESDCSESFELNRTHTLVRIDNTISIVRPVITDDCGTVTSIENGCGDSQPANKELVCENSSAKMPSLLNEDQIDAIPRNKDENAFTKNNSKTKRNSKFYDADNVSKSVKSSTSTLHKASKACAIL